ncbi:MAG: hypothetical protein DRQ55_11920 [Planctomycetota bacterium]|nr:MAG: hypothetical protein DRQ55_11920 [Planctomycetota bacterium]
MSTDKNPAPDGWLLAGVALVSAAVLLLQLVQTRIFSVMLWYHLTYLVVTFTMLGFAAGGTLLACRARWLEGDVSRRLRNVAMLFGAAVVASYAVVTRIAPDSDHSVNAILTSALQYGLLVLPMIAGGLLIALALSTARASVGRVYAWNMAGSALGCALYVPLLRALGGEGSVLLAAALCFAGAGLLARARVPANERSPTAADASTSTPASGAQLAPAGAGRTLPPWIAAAALTLMALFAPKLAFEVPLAFSKGLPAVIAYSKEDPESPELRIEETRWDPLCRLDVVGPGEDVDPYGQRTIFQDGDAPTRVPFGAAQLSEDLGQKEALGYVTFRTRPPRVLAIGIGGGLDILMAKVVEGIYPDDAVVDFTGVEINATTIELMRGKYRDSTDNRYELPGVTIHNDEGRSWLQRSDERYDLLQMSGIDTYAALSSGSYIMSESYLYTVEAYQDYLEHLTDDGVISVLRYRFDPPRENLRLAAIAVEALRRSGVEHPEQHVIMVGVYVPFPEGWDIDLDYGCLLVSKTPFGPERVKLYQRYAGINPDYFLQWAPGVDCEGEFADYFASVMDGTDDEFVANYPYRIDPVTDDAPFFFRYHRWDRIGEYLFGDDEQLTAAESAPAMSTTRAQQAGRDLTDLVGGEPVGLILLLTVLLESTALVLVLVLLPLWFFKRSGLAAAGAGRWVLYFFGLGAGYMLIEVATMQRFSLFLGHPGYSITVVLFSFLIFSGLGAAWAGRSDDPARTLRRGLLGVLALVVLLNLALPSFFAAGLRLDLPLRIGLTVAVLAPLAFLMGMPFPSGLALLGARTPALTAWAFGVNGGASVLASVAGIMVAMTWGFSVAFIVGASSYALSLLAARGLQRAS